MQTIWLQRPSEDIPWGFRLHGGRDYQEPLSVSRVTAGSIASTGLSQGDHIYRIGDTDTSTLTQIQAQDLIKSCGNLLQFTIGKRSGAGRQPMSPQVADSSRMEGRLHELFDEMLKHSDGIVQGNPPGGTTYGNVAQSASHVQTPSYPYSPSTAQANQPGATPYHHNYQPAAPTPYSPSSQPYMGTQPSCPPPSYDSLRSGGSGYSQHPPGGMMSRAQPAYPAGPPQAAQQRYPHSIPIDSRDSYSSSNYPYEQYKPTPEPSSPYTSGNAPQYGMYYDSQSPTGYYPGYQQTPGGMYGGYNDPPPEPAGPACYGYGGPPTAPPPPPTPQYNYNDSFGSYSPDSSRTAAKPPQSPVTPPPMPDKVLNMAHKGGPDKKPWAYAPDMSSIKEQRDRVRRRGPSTSMPKYQQALNLPSFSDVPVAKPQNRYADDYTDRPSSDGQTVIPVVHAQYNTPIDMYSEHNLKEELAGQIGVRAAGAPGQMKPDPNAPAYQQSETYKMIHGIDSPKPRIQRVGEAGVRQRPIRQPSEDDEITFTGVNKPTAIPSKSFQMLQKMTGAEGQIDQSSIRPRELGENNNQIGHYDETSIRYLGKNIPSKSFKMLASTTGTEGYVPEHPTQRSRKKVQVMEEEEEYDPDAVDDRRYVGGNIPSRSFKMLQQSVGGPEDSQGPDDEYDKFHPDMTFDRMEYTGAGIPSKAFKLLNQIVPEETPEEKARRRRRGRRQKKEIEQQQVEEREFDESAYLSGRIPVVRDKSEWRPPPEEPEKSQTPKAPWVKENIEDDDQSDKPFDEKKFLGITEPVRKKKDEDEEDGRMNENFDEATYLAGGIPLGVGDAPRPMPQKEPPKKSHVPWEREIVESPDAPFDESFYLGKPIVVQSKEKDYWAKEQDEEEVFDEDAYLGRKIAAESKENVPWKHKVKVTDEAEFDENKFLGIQIESVSLQGKDEEDDVANGHFDEETYLGRKVSISSEEKVPWHREINENPDAPFDEDQFVKKTKTVKVEVAVPWQKQKLPEELEKPDAPFDENAYLGGKFDLRDPKSRKRAVKVKAYENSTQKKQEEEEEPTNNEAFDEEAYLSGKVSILGAEPTSKRPPRDPRKRTNDTRAPWQRNEDECITDDEFDEEDFLKGRIMVTRRSIDREVPAPRREAKRRTRRKKAVWERSADECVTDDEYDEDEYLRGKFSVVRGSIDRQITIPRQGRSSDSDSSDTKPRRASWQKENEDEGLSDAEFDESRYLAGKISVMRESFERDVGSKTFSDIPSKAFGRLRRSISQEGSSQDSSREGSPGSDVPRTPRRTVLRGSTSDDDGGQHYSDEVYNDMAYVGGKIPSKSFKMLNRILAKEKPGQIDPLESLRRKNSRDELDVDDAIEKMKIDQHNPENYMDLLRESVKNSDIKVELGEEVTDF